MARKRETGRQRARHRDPTYAALARIYPDTPDTTSRAVLSELLCVLHRNADGSVCRRRRRIVDASTNPTLTSADSQGREVASRALRGPRRDHVARSCEGATSRCDQPRRTSQASNFPTDGDMVRRTAMIPEALSSHSPVPRSLAAPLSGRSLGPPAFARAGRAPWRRRGDAHAGSRGRV